MKNLWFKIEDWVIKMSSNDSSSFGSNGSYSSDAKDKFPPPLKTPIIEGKISCWCNGCRGSVTRKAWECGLHIQRFGQFEGTTLNGAPSSSHVELH